MISEMVAALGLTDRLMAVTDYCDFPAAITALRDNGSTIGGFFNPSYEKVISFNPDLIILDSGVQAQTDMAAQLRGAGYTVILLYPASDLESVYKNIGMVGNATGTQDIGGPMVSRMKAQVEDIANAVASESQPNIMFVTYADEGFTNVWPAGGTTSIGEIIDLAGGKNVFESMSGYEMASNEVLMDKSSTVDVIIMTVMYSPETPENKSAWFKADPIWKESPAVKNNKVYYLTGQAENIFNRESVRTVDAVQLLAEILHPDAFASKVPYSADAINLIGDEYTDYLPSGTASQVGSVTIMAAVARD